MYAIALTGGPAVVYKVVRKGHGCWAHAARMHLVKKRCKNIEELKSCKFDFDLLRNELRVQRVDLQALSDEESLPSNREVLRLTAATRSIMAR